MKKKSPKPADPSIDEELKQLFAQQEAFEYHGLLDEQEIAAAKSKYLELLIRIDRSIFSEEERKEIEQKLADTWEEIERVDLKARHARDKVASLRERLERVQKAHQARRRSKRS